MDKRIKVVYVPTEILRPHEENPRRWTNEAVKQLRESIKKHGLIDPIVVNAAPGRENVILSGHFRHRIAKELGMKQVPVVYLRIADRDRERDIVVRMNKAVGEFDEELLANFPEAFLADVGFTSEELDEIFEMDDTPEIFDLEKELKKLDIAAIETKKGDLYQVGDHKILCGDSTIEADVLRLMDGEKADMCLTDPPYLLDYLHGKKRRGKATKGFGLKRDRRYLETESLPENFTELWMANVAKVQKPDFSIIVFENPKNLRTIWNALEKHWKYRNTIVWHLPNRVQGFAAKYKFFNKHDISILGTAGNVALNVEPESGELLQNEYENALYATSGTPHWEGYERGKKICPTDFIEFNAADEKSSGQGIIFGTKPIEILIPYIKVLTKRGDLVLDPFGGSGSTMVAAHKLGRRCFMMEKSPVYVEVIKKRVEKLTGNKAKIIP